MKSAIVSIVCMALLSGAGTAYACSVLDKKRAHRGVSEGFRGECSNNGFSITCLLQEGSWVTCDGVGGTYSGTNLQSLIFSACKCRAQEERRKELIEEMRDY